MAICYNYRLMKEIKCVVSGSFTKAKDRIDRVITDFEEAGFKVLSPKKGGLYYPDANKLWRPGFYPLLHERGMSEFEAKHFHLMAIKRADFTYFCAPNGYVGISVAAEMGMALAKTAVYVDEPIDSKLDGGFWEDFIRSFEVKSPEEVIKIWTKIKDSPLDLRFNSVYQT